MPSNKGPAMPPSNPANHTSRTLLLAGDSKNTVLAELAGSIHRLAYSPYGQQSSGQEVGTRLGFNGELREAKNDWYFLGNGYRVYNPRLMGFQSPDKFSPFGKGGINPYMYCGGDPANRADPTGEGWFFKVFTFFNELFSGVGSGGGSLGRTSTTVMPISNSRSTFSTPSRLQPLGKSRKHPSAFPIQHNGHNATTKSVHWAPGIKEAAPSAKATTSTNAQSGTMSRSPSSSSVTSHSSSASTPSTVSTVSSVSLYSRDSGYASSAAGSIRSNSSADQHIQERLDALRRN